MPDFFTWCTSRPIEVLAEGVEATTEPPTAEVIELPECARGGDYWEKHPIQPPLRWYRPARWPGHEGESST